MNACHLLSWGPWRQHMGIQPIKVNFLQRPLTSSLRLFPIGCCGLWILNVRRGVACNGHNLHGSHTCHTKTAMDYIVQSHVCSCNVWFMKWSSLKCSCITWKWSKCDLPVYSAWLLLAKTIVFDSWPIAKIRSLNMPPWLENEPWIMVQWQRKRRRDCEWTDETYEWTSPCQRSDRRTYASVTKGQRNGGERDFFQPRQRNCSGDLLTSGSIQGVQNY